MANLVRWLFGWDHPNPALPYYGLDKKEIQRLAYLCQLIYSPEHETWTDTKPHRGISHLNRIISHRYCIEYDKHKKTQTIVVRGTDNFWDILLDADLLKRPIQGSRVQEVAAHRGFLRAASLVADDIKPYLKPKYKTIITGHSLGGAVAVLLCLILKDEQEGIKISSVVTFGQPKVVNRKDGEKIASMIPLVRFVHSMDVVSALPPSMLGYDGHFGKEVWTSIDVEHLLYDRHRSTAHKGEEELDSGGSVMDIFRTRSLDAVRAHRMQMYVDALNNVKRVKREKK